MSRSAVEGKLRKEIGSSRERQGEENLFHKTESVPRVMFLFAFALSVLIHAFLEIIVLDYIRLY